MPPVARCRRLGASRSIGSLRLNTRSAARPPPVIKQADRAKPGAHLSLRNTRGGSDLLTLHAPETQTSRPREVAEAALCHVDCGLGGAWRRSDRLAARREPMASWVAYL